MSILDTAVSIANSVTKSLNMQANVTYEKFLSLDGAGNKTYAGAVVTPAIVTLKQKLVRDATGQQVMSTTSVVILDPTFVINVLDRITLQNGVVQPILTLEGYVSKETGNPILTEIYLG